MIPIKIQCGCGQKYAFDVEPVGGQMPGAVSCPVCGVDGTGAANSVLAQHFASRPTVVASAPATVALPSPGGAVRVASAVSLAAPAAPSVARVSVAPVSVAPVSVVPS